MPNKRELESKIQWKIKNTLSLFCPSVVWVDRLNSGAIKTADAYIKLCAKGTPDLYALVNHGGGHIVFIEVKRVGGKQSQEQKDFEDMVRDFDHIHYVLAFKTSDVITYINKIIIDKLP